MIEEIIRFNQEFVEGKQYEKFATDKFPGKKLAILSCMDTRLTELLPAALGIKNGDAKIIKNAGGVIQHPYGSVVRSLLIAVLDLGVTEVMVIGHTDCGVANLDADRLVSKMLGRGISMESIEFLKYSGIDFYKWLGGFDTVEQSVEDTVTMLKKHPLIPKDVVIQGFVMDSDTGELKQV